MEINYEFLKTMAKVSNIPIEEVARRIGHAEFENNPLQLRKSRTVPMPVLEKGIMDRIRSMFGRGAGSDVPSAPASSPETPSAPADTRSFSERTRIGGSRPAKTMKEDAANLPPEPTPAVVAPSNLDSAPPLGEQSREGPSSGRGNKRVDPGFTFKTTGPEGFSSVTGGRNGLLHNFNDSALASFGNAVNSYINPEDGSVRPQHSPERLYAKLKDQSNPLGFARWIQGTHSDYHKRWAAEHGVDPAEDVSHPNPYEMAKLLEKHNLELVNPYEYARGLIGQGYSPHSRLTQSLFGILSRNSPAQLRPDNLVSFAGIVKQRPRSSPL